MTLRHTTSYTFSLTAYRLADITMRSNANLSTTMPDKENLGAAFAFHL